MCGLFLSPNDHLVQEGSPLFKGSFAQNRLYLSIYNTLRYKVLLGNINKVLTR